MFQMSRGLFNLTQNKYNTWPSEGRDRVKDHAPWTKWYQLKDLVKDRRYCGKDQAGLEGCESVGWQGDCVTGSLSLEMHEPEPRPVSRSLGTPKKNFMAEPWCLKSQDLCLKCYCLKGTSGSLVVQPPVQSWGSFELWWSCSRNCPVKFTRSPRMEISQLLWIPVPMLGHLHREKCSPCV